MTQKYAEYLGSEAWEQKRKQRLAISNWKCAACGSGHQLQVHHLTYERIFNEEMADLLPLCEYHHAAAEELIRAGTLKRTGNPMALATETVRLVLTYGKQVVKPKQQSNVKPSVQIPRNATAVMLTKQLIHSAGRNGIGFNKVQLAVLGVSWPPRKNWLRKLIGTKISREQWEKFVALRRVRPSDKPALTSLT